MDLSIVIVNYNGASFLTGCLDAIFDGMLNCEFEVIVIDNASQDQSLSVLERYQYPLKRIDNADNRGFAAANNQGVAIAEGRYVFLLNNDTVVAPDAIQTLVDF
ncbi:glycosyltransferase, partial [bacterium]|nr:glycosyltransferase [bacterium]